MFLLDTASYYGKTDMLTYYYYFQVKAIRKKMVDIITKEVSSNDMKEIVNKLYVFKKTLVILKFFSRNSKIIFEHCGKLGVEQE